MKRLLIVGLITLSCCRTVGEVKVHDKTKVYQQQKQLTKEEKAALAISVFILIGMVNNAL